MSGKAFFMSASKFLRAAAQTFESLIGTWQPPLPLQAFSPGVLTSALQPPRPAQSLSPAQVWALAVAHSPPPAKSFLPPSPLPLQVFRPRQMFGSWDISGLLLSFAFASAATARPAPANMPPRAAAANLPNARRFRSCESMGSPCVEVDGRRLRNATGAGASAPDHRGHSRRPERTLPQKCGGKIREGAAAAAPTKPAPPGLSLVGRPLRGRGRPLDEAHASPLNKGARGAGALPAPAQTRYNRGVSCPVAPGGRREARGPGAWPLQAIPLTGRTKRSG